MSVVRILVIGNGFDKAHGLKTGYSDFINWVEGINNVHEQKGRGLQNYSKEEEINECILSAQYPKEYSEIINIKTNFWMCYFSELRGKIGDTWLDFEKEIEKFTKRIYEIQNAKGILSARDTLRNSVKGTSFGERFVNKEQLFQWLDKELRIFTRSFEIYLCVYVNGSLDQNARISPFTDIKPDKLISFNYTSTYNDVYDEEIPKDYIHGKANFDSEKDECDLVLGFDDHYFESSDTILELVPFEKYYQRIVYRNTNDYFKWIEESEKNGDYIEIHFYGHSMSPADGDIIKLLIETANTKTKIYYRKDHNEERANMIKNLAVILTPNGLIKRMGGSHPTIEMIPV